MLRIHLAMGVVLTVLFGSLAGACAGTATTSGTEAATAAPAGGVSSGGGGMSSAAGGAVASPFFGMPLSGPGSEETLIARWTSENPDWDWEAEERKSRTFIPAFDNSSLLEGSAPPSRTFSKTDLLTWKRESEKLVVAGSKVFHSGAELGSTNGVSCDMCHPNGANTHAETYPKFQVQMGRVALLRDMINWCLINPARAPAMAADDPRMRAMEAYLLSTRSGKALAFGKH